MLERADRDDIRAPSAHGNSTPSALAVLCFQEAGFLREGVDDTESTSRAGKYQTVETGILLGEGI
jgi:hypothetical protein